jgi:hypothetical protein
VIQTVLQFKVQILFDLFHVFYGCLIKHISRLKKITPHENTAQLIVCVAYMLEVFAQKNAGSKRFQVLWSPPHIAGSERSKD